MTISIDAIVENGMLRPLQPLPLQENERVRITVESTSNWIQRSYGLCGWKGTTEELERIALAPEFDDEDEQ